MIRFRVRIYGTGEWTEVSFDGELEDLMAASFVDRIPTEIHLQRQVENQFAWEDE